MKHTPGPWTIDEVQIDDYRVDISTKDWNVACAYYMSDNATEPDPECMANARLIAAAPELLEALQYLLEQTVRMAVQYGIKLTEGEQYALTLTEKAIAKATGQGEE